MRRRLLLVPLVLAVGSILLAAHSAHAKASTVQCGPAVNALAAEIVTNLTETTYSNHPLNGAPNVALVDGQWKSNTDCSGFVSFVLSETAEESYATVAALKESTHAWPRAHVYRRFFASLPKVLPQKGWLAVRDLRKAKPGDVLAWCIDSYCTATGDVPEPGDTGHIVIIGKVRQLDAETLSVMVYDSSAVLHYGNPPYTCEPHDEPCKVTGRNGAGLGAIHFKIDDTGAPIAFQFHGGGTWHPEPSETILFAVGRPAGRCE